MENIRGLPATSIILASLASLALWACAPKYYSANTQNVPLFSRAGDGAAAASINPDANRADVHAALAVTGNVAVQANAALYFPRDEDSTGNGGSGGLFEAGVGYYQPLPRRFVFETYGLVAFGGLENHFPLASGNPTGKLNANLVRLAIQPAIGYKRRYFEAAISNRIAMLDYFNIEGTLTRDGESQERYLRDNRLQFSFEPALTLRAGIDVLKAEIQLGRSFNAGNEDFPQDDQWASLGLVYTFSPEP